MTVRFGPVTQSYTSRVTTDPVALTIFSIMIVLLLFGFPMMIPLIAGAFVGFYWMFGGFGQLETMVQQMMAGIRPASLIA